MIIGLVDADLMDGGTRHPNLTLLKLAGFFHDHRIEFELIEDENADISKYRLIYISKVFTFTKNPKFFDEKKEKSLGEDSQFRWGGTGFYANETDQKKFIKLRKEDMARLEKDEFLNQYICCRGLNKKKGISMAHQMPYYDLYRPYIEKMIANGHKRDLYKDYLDYSIGFLTRGCFRQCPFCVNRLEKLVLPYSDISSFLDNDRDEKGKLKRPYIYLWDDNFLASSPKLWRPLLNQLIETGRPFQFRQGLDERMLADSPHGEEMAETLSRSKYHGDYIFAFDNWSDREKIVKALKIWKRHNPKKGTKFYLFCGFKQTSDDFEKFYQDIWEIFNRIKILMQYGCIGYIMRHEDYKNSPLPNMYVQIARWCNQQQFYKKMSLWEFCYRNQSFWEEQYLPPENIAGRPALMSFEDFEAELNNPDGHYKNIKLCKSLRTILEMLNMYPDKKKELLEMFNYKMSNLKNPSLWENQEQ